MQKLDDARYDSVADFLASLSELRSDVNGACAREYMTQSNASFYGAGCRTGADVISKMRDGWPEGQAATQSLLHKASAADAVPVDRRRRLSRGDYGDQLDMGAVYRGRLDVAWSRAVRRPTFGPQKIDLVANMLCSAMLGASVLQWRGCAAVALADKLEAAGYMVRIVVGFGGATTFCNESVSCRITVKDYDKPLDIATAATVTMPGFFRALGHCWIARHAKGYVRSGSINGTGECKRDADEILLSHDVYDEATALAFINAQIAKLNEPQAA